MFNNLILKYLTTYSISYDIIKSKNYVNYLNIFIIYFLAMKCNVGYFKLNFNFQSIVHNSIYILFLYGPFHPKIAYKQVSLVHY